MSSDYRSGLLKERAWRLSDKRKLLTRLSHKRTNKAFNQVMKLINEHTTELIKIERLLKDSFVEVWNA